MIKKKLKSMKGITLTSLAIAILVILILTGVTVYNLEGGLKLEKLEKLQSDISNLRGKISNYYMQYGEIPAKLIYPNTEHINKISPVVDTGEFYVIDLSAIENLTLNYGEDYEHVKQFNSLSSEIAKQYTDLYIINKDSHNIFYVEGITIDNETYYTDYEEVDTKPVDLRYVENVKIPDGYYYDSGTKASGIIIKKENDETQSYTWIVQNTEITEIPSDISVEEAQKQEFIKSVNQYKGYYKDNNSNKVIYLEVTE